MTAPHRPREDHERSKLIWLDHTADAGFTVRAATPAGVYSRAVQALRQLLWGDIPVARTRTLPLRLDGCDRAERLVTLLEEVLYRLEVEQFVTADAELEPDPDQEGVLVGLLRGEEYAAERHPARHEVKAITYHRLRFEPTAEGYEATVVVDL